VVGEGTSGAILDKAPIPAVSPDRFAWTVLPSVERAKAKQAVNIRNALMTGIVAAVPVRKKTMGILHSQPPQSSIITNTLG
jgi:hypothetical protein